ncbi:PPA1309 family protein [uncultured Williamsia sp.]|uniref:PPA1309 family protein n=1 Tax=uncultured Williamsia sp. TaxID=259311 RepID=UPI002630C136|nr:PPA1309 family protein [uncultured Williamsia sp.]
MTSPDVPLSPDALGIAVREVAEFVDAGGWGQPPVLFALVPTAVVAQAQPDLADTLDESELTLIEQESLPVAPDSGMSEIEHVLGTTSWPAAVAGCALVQEIIVLPPDAESDLDEAFGPLLADPDAADEAARQTAREHPEATDARLIAAAMRDGRTLCLLQLKPPLGEEDAPIELLSHPELAPNLVAAVAATLENDPEDW